MSKTTRRTVLQLLLASVSAVGLAACGGSDDPGPMMRVDATGSSNFTGGALDAQLSTMALQALSSAEAESLAFMREEEQLAHAVYARSALIWPALPIFANIAASEATHTAAVKALLDRYQLPDPLAGLAVGSFATPLFQTLHADLVAASSTSLIEALKVGAQIEELDIRDISVQKATIDNADILLVYDNLLRGSRNHLRAYMRTLTQQGGAYVPVYISQSDFDAIVDAPMETGP